MAVVPYGFTLPEWVGSAGASLSEHSYEAEGSVVLAKPRLCNVRDAYVCRLVATIIIKMKR